MGRKRNRGKARKAAKATKAASEEVEERSGNNNHYQTTSEQSLSLSAAIKEELRNTIEEFHEWLDMPEQEDIRAKIEALLSSVGVDISLEGLLESDTFQEIHTYYKNQTGEQLSAEQFQVVLMMHYLSQKPTEERFDAIYGRDNHHDAFFFKSDEKNDDGIADTDDASIVNTPALTATACMHGVKKEVDQVYVQFVKAFTTSMDALTTQSRLDPSNLSKLMDWLKSAHDATIDAAEVWSDSAKMKMAISLFLRAGTTAILMGEYKSARAIACIVRYFEEHIAVELEQSRALINWPKILETSVADVHTLVKFFSKRTPCSCLDEKYDEVKDITKMSLCYNPQCTIPHGKVERSKIMCCGRCQSVMYCSRECQKAHWRVHKSSCNSYAEMKAEFETKQQTM